MLKIDISNLNKWIKRIDSEELNNIICNIVVPAIKQNFDAGGKNEQGQGNIWKPSKKALAEGRKTLIDTTNMQQSVYCEIKNGIISIYSRARSKKGYNYPVAHQLGLGYNPVRMWKVITIETRKRILKAIVDFLRK